MLTRPRDSFLGSSLMSFRRGKKTVRSSSSLSKTRKLAIKQSSSVLPDRSSKIPTEMLSAAEETDPADDNCIDDINQPEQKGTGYVEPLFIESKFKKIDTPVKSPKNYVAPGWFETPAAGPIDMLQVTEAVVIDAEDAVLRPLPWVQSVNAGWTSGGGTVPSASAWRRLPGRVAPHGGSFIRS